MDTRFVNGQVLIVGGHCNVCFETAALDLDAAHMAFELLFKKVTGIHKPMMFDYRNLGNLCGMFDDRFGKLSSDQFGIDLFVFKTVFLVDLGEPFGKRCF